MPTDTLTSTDPYLACAGCPATAPREQGLPRGWKLTSDGRAVCAKCARDREDLPPRR